MSQGCESLPNLEIHRGCVYRELRPFLIRIYLKIASHHAIGEHVVIVVAQLGLKLAGRSCWRWPTSSPARASPSRNFTSSRSQWPSRLSGRGLLRRVETASPQDFKSRPSFSGRGSPGGNGLPPRVLSGVRGCVQRHPLQPSGPPSRVTVRKWPPVRKHETGRGHLRPSPPSRAGSRPRSRRPGRTRLCRKTATFHSEVWPSSPSPETGVFPDKFHSSELATRFHECGENCCGRG